MRPEEGAELMPGPIAMKLRALREERGLSHKQAAELAGITAETLIDLEGGERPPYMPTVTKLARAYGVPIEELADEPGPPSPL
jgi:XRE family transcriptional regulator, regulator of sulfur utilization